ncbi:MAG TPA: peptidylprolyl isomerase, partial [Balneolales bacterium]|nr:peptidylprolyl isomerase [Balneolales bacterium]
MKHRILTGNLSVLLIVVLFSGIASAQSAPQLVDGVAAVVQDEVILYSDVQQYAQMQAMQIGFKPYNDPQRFQQLETQVLQSLIDQKIIQAKAEEDSIEVKDHEIDQALQQQIDNMVAQAGSEKQLEQMLGMSISKIKNEYRDDVRKRLLIDKYQQSKFADISVSRREVEQFYKTYKDSIPDIAKRVNISHIVLSVKPSESADSAAVQKLRDIKKQIENGASFEEMAQKYSEDPGSKNQGGDLGFVS